MKGILKMKRIMAAIMVICEHSQFDALEGGGIESE